MGQLNHPLLVGWRTRHHRSSRSVVTAVATVAAIAATLLTCAQANAAWVQPAPGRLNADATTQKLPVLARVGSDVFAAGVESSGVGADQLIVRRLTPGQSTWQQVGQKLNFNDNATPSSPSIAVVAGVPYVAWQEQNALTGVVQVYVKRLAQAPSPDTWEQVGGSLNPDPGVNSVSPDIVDAGGQAHVTFATAASGLRRAHVFKYVSSSWQQVGGPIYVDAVRDAVAPKLAFAAGKLAIAWSERLAGDDRLHVAVYDDGTSSWGAQGGELNDPEGSAVGKSLEVVGGTPMVAFTAVVSGYERLYVKRLPDGASTWELIGDALNVTTGDARTPSLANIGGRPYVTHGETVVGVQCIVLSRLADSGDQWEVLPEFVGPNPASAATLADVAQTPWVALVEQSGAGAVWRLAPSVTTLDVDASTGGATVHAQSETFGLPFDIAADVRVPQNGSVILGAPSGGPGDLLIVFAGLASATQYEARVHAADQIGFSFDLASLPFTTDTVEQPVDDEEPVVGLKWRKRLRGRPSVSGVASDGQALARVEVAIAFDRRAKRCRWVVGSRLTEGDCVEPEWQVARGTSAFRLPLARKLVKQMMRRPYEVYARAYDAVGNVSDVDAYRCGRRSVSPRSRKPIARCSQWQ